MSLRRGWESLCNRLSRRASLETTCKSHPIKATLLDKWKARGSRAAMVKIIGMENDHGFAKIAPTAKIAIGMGHTINGPSMDARKWYVVRASRPSSVLSPSTLPMRIIRPLPNSVSGAESRAKRSAGRMERCSERRGFRKPSEPIVRPSKPTE